MPQKSTIARPVPIPEGRVSRFARLGSLAGGVLGNVAVNGAREWSRGNRPDLRSLLITPANLHRMTEELAKMRGAAMKIGQLLSMDAGELLPPELADILARLRADAHFMPPAQLKERLNANWAAGWLKEFERFDVRPLAAASIGQVHRAVLRDGTELAIKVQYPGVARSIDSDVANVGALVRMSGLLPKGFDLAPYLEEARLQLHEETDYLREGAHLRAFGERLDGSDDLLVPTFFEERSTKAVLSMSFASGQPIEDVADAPKEMRDRVARLLIELMLRELFEFGEMQTDPNFANYLFDPATSRIVLLDFGATRTLSPALVGAYRRFLTAGLAGDEEALSEAAENLGFVQAGIAPRHRLRILGMMEMAFAAIRQGGTYDFADMTLSRQMQAEGMALAEDGFVPPPVPMDVLFIQRKLGGLFLLAGRLGARVPLKDLVARYIAGAPRTTGAQIRAAE